jgi:hypothetical protein
MEMGARYAPDAQRSAQNSSDMLYNLERSAKHATVNDSHLHLVENCTQGRVVQTTGRWLLKLVESGCHMDSFN